MDRPTPTVADVFRRYGDAYRDLAGPALSLAQCGHTRIWYNSCLMGSDR